MPELPEVETTRRGLMPHVIGARIDHTVVRRFDLREEIPADLARQLKGGEITDITRRSKYLLIHVRRHKKPPIILLIHLGMSGSVRLEKPGFELKKHDHVVWGLSSGEHMVFHDPRRFGVITLLSPAEITTHPLLEHLGPEPFSDHFSVDYLQRALSTRGVAIKPTLMDGKIVVGVGNIYASESLFLCGIHPDTPACDLSRKQLQKLIKAVRITLQAAIDSGGSTLRDYVQSSGNTGYFQHSFKVYDRAGEPCVTCGAPIVYKVHAGRATYWCEICQPRHL